MDLPALLLCVGALLAGLALGWWLASRAGGEAGRLLRLQLDGVRDERDAATAERERLRGQHDQARQALARLEATEAERARGFAAQLAEVKQAKDELSLQFNQIGGKLLAEAQAKFLERADQRFAQAEEKSGIELKALLQPVSERLQRYEEGVARVEAERRDAFGNLTGLIESMRIGQEKVSSEAAKLVNSLRDAPKARGRWGEQQLRNVLETCGLVEHCDFATEVSVDSDDGRFRPDVIVRVPGGRTLVIDAKVSLNAFQDAFGAVEESERAVFLRGHAAAMKAHVNALGAKAYQTRFADTADFVIMFVPGEHFATAAYDSEPGLWDYAFERRVLIATPANLIAIARTVAAVWRQEQLATDARKIAEMGKEMHDRLAVAADHLRVVGGGLNTAVKRYNEFVGSFERNVMSTGRKFRDLAIEPSSKTLDQLSPIEVLARYDDPDAGPPALEQAAE